MSLEINTIDPRIEKFVLRHHVLTLATVSPSGCYCSNMFYAYLPELGGFVFASDSATRHAREASGNENVAASVVVESKVVGILQGLQVCGSLKNEAQFDEGVREKMRKAYLKRFPYAVAAELNLWLLEATFLKFTDNKLGFGKKLLWQK